MGSDTGRRVVDHVDIVQSGPDPITYRVETCSVVFISPNGIVTRLDLNLFGDAAPRMDARDRAIALALLDVARERLASGGDS